MKMTKLIRYIGLGLLILSVLMLLYLFSFTLFKDSKPASSDRYAVLEITEGSNIFPRTDYDVLFAGMNLVSSSVKISADSSAETEQEKIAAAIDASGSDHVILLAWEKAAVPALTAALNRTDVASVILLSPTLTGTDAMESFGTHQPDIPVAVFDVKTVYSKSLYERLSGEDATIFEGLTDSGIMPAEVFISPDGSRYLSQWSLTGRVNFDRYVLTFLPQVQSRIGEYISGFIQHAPLASSMACRNHVAFAQSVKIIAAVFLTAGLFLFFASISKAKRPAGGQSSLPPAATPGADVSAGPFQGQAADKGPDILRGRTQRGRFFLHAAAAVLVSGALLFLYPGHLFLGKILLACWPLLYYAASDILLVRFVPQSLIRGHIPGGRMRMSLTVALLFLAGVFLLKAMHVYSVGQSNSALSNLLPGAFAASLFVLGWIAVSAEAVLMNRKESGDGVCLDASRWYRTGTILLPYAAVLVFQLAARQAGLRILYTVFLLAVLYAGFWLRRIIRRTSGTEWMAAAAFSVFYTMIVFG